ncbi:MAG: PGPGW domain-containing protein [Desulfovibrionales bacterium]
MRASLLSEFSPALEQWLDRHETLVWLLGLSSVIMFFGTLLGLVFIIVKLPPDHFVRDYRKHPLVPIQNPIVWVVYLIVKNIVGIIFIVGGLAMLLLPGQGLLSLLIGISLTSFPGKRRLIRFIIRRKAVLRSANWIRRKFHRQPLIAPK